VLVFGRPRPLFGEASFLAMVANYTVPCTVNKKMEIRQIPRDSASSSC
jgi:hypothetical protein